MVDEIRIWEQISGAITIVLGIIGTILGPVEITYTIFGILTDISLELAETEELYRTSLLKKAEVAFETDGWEEAIYYIKNFLMPIAT